MQIYYKVTGPMEFKEDMTTKCWMEISTWASKTIVTYSARQDVRCPGKLFNIVWKPPEAPPDVARLRIPEDWVTEIPGLKVIEKDVVEQWQVERDQRGNLRVVRK